MEGLIILIVSVTALVAMIVWLLATGFRNRWPEGTRVEAEYKGHKVTMIIAPRWAPGPGISFEGRALALAKAVWASAEAWRRATDSEARDVSEVAVYIADRATFDALLPTAGSIGAAFLGRVPRRLGQGPPLISIRAELAEHLFATGEPMLHEMMHALTDQYAAVGDGATHQNPVLWTEHADNPGSVQARARALYGGAMEEL